MWLLPVELTIYAVTESSSLSVSRQSSCSRLGDPQPVWYNDAVWEWHEDPWVSGYLWVIPLDVVLLLGFESIM
jgi:hypothetical protein